MGRSDDSISRRRSKRSRKKQEENTNKVSQRVAAIIAAKKRRITGKRRLCQGMCYSLPTIEDPFNEKLGKVDFVKKSKKPASSKREKMKNKNSVKSLKQVEQMTMAGLGTGKTRNGTDIKSHLYCPSKFLIACLDRVQKALQQDGTLKAEEKPFFVHPWGIDFWKAYSIGEDVIETSCAEARVEEIAWIAATCTDTIAREEKEGQSFAGPFLVFIVPSQERASEVRQICKSLKDCGIRTVSLHSGASIDHQIHGLKSCEPEFVISTPERLLELVSLNAIDITGISMLVIENPEAISEGGYVNAIESIKNSIPASSHKVVFSDSQ
ncbi:RNA helicase [Lithospermum erythrorhizon]|uniref:RNA helicase n=1 Tax=Lithospermum erythrorhizon TaxID=34254 RepID=A0AAV3QMI2_LITER